MINLKPKGPWRELNSLLKSYPERVKYVSRRAAQDLAEAFLKKLIDSVPDGEEFSTYAKSLEVVELTATGGHPAFGIICRRDKVRLGAAVEGGLLGKTVVYIFPSVNEPMSEVAPLLEEGNPWPADLVPHGIDKSDVMLVHRIVTEGEMKWARARTMELITGHRSEFKRHGIHWGKAIEKEKHADELESLPDFMSLALRAEFGINMNPSPHWRPAMEWLMTHVEEVLDKDEKIHLALHDELFRGHTLSQRSEHPTMKAKDFQKEAGAFQQKVIG